MDLTREEIATKKRWGQTWLFSSLSNHRILWRVQTEFRVNWFLVYDATWEPRDNVPEEAKSGYFPNTRRASPPPLNEDGQSELVIGHALRTPHCYAATAP